MDAVRLLARAELRQRRGSIVVLALTTAFVVGTLLAVTAGARRTTGVLDRFLAETNAADTYLGFYWPSVADDPARVVGMLDQIRDLDGVLAAEARSLMPVQLPTTDDFLVRTPYETSTTGDELDRPVVVDGRMPEPGNPFEVAVNEVAASQLGLRVGDHLEGRTVSPQAAAGGFEDHFDEAFPDDGPEVRLEIVGVVRELGDLSPTGTENPAAIGTSPFHDAYPDASRFSTMFRLRTDPRSFDVAAALGVISSEVPGNAEVFTGGTEDLANGTRTAFDAIATGLVVFALVGSVVGLLVLALVVIRHVQAGRDERRVAKVMGVTPRTSALSAVLPLAASVLVGVVAGTLGAYLASGLFPYGVARNAELSSGPRLDPLVHLASAAAVAAVLVAGVAALTRRQVALDDHVTPPGTSHLTGLRTTLPPPIADGCSTVLWQSRRSTSLRPWTAIAGAVIGVAGIVGIAVFERTRSEAVADPAAYGTTWDVRADVLVDDPMAVVESLAVDGRVAAVAGVLCGVPIIDRSPTQLCSYEVFSGSIAPTVLDGRTPNSPTEIALGELTADRLGLAIGSTLTIEDLDGVPAELSVVGLVVNPLLTDSPAPGEGVVMTTAGLERILGDPFALPYANLVFSVAEGRDIETTGYQLAEDYPIDVSPYSFARPPGDLVQLGRMRTSLIALAWFLGGLGAIGLTHYLVLSGRRRRGEIAVLRALGFVRAQVFESTAAQAVTVALIGVVIGLPLGLVTGRWTWMFAVRDLGIGTDPVSPGVIVLVVVAATLIGSVAVAMLPAWRTVRTRPSDALREE